MTRDKVPAIEKLIRRCLKNGIKTAGDGRGTVKVITFANDQAMFLALVQADASHMEHSFDQGQNPEKFKALVEQIQARMGDS